MKISTKGRYALRLMLELSLHDPTQWISVKEIAEHQEISSKYLEQIITQLHRAGLVQSIRGAQGGYRLSKAPADCTVGMILRAVEGELAPVSCLEGDNCCPRQDSCVTLEVWSKIQQAINSVVDHMTLQDLVDRYYEKQTT